MAREFTVSMSNVTIVGATTLVFINPAAGGYGGFRVLRAWCGQSGSVTQENLQVALVSQVTAFPTLTSATPQKTKRADPNAAVITGGTAGAAGTAGTNASAEGAGTKTIVHPDTFNNVIGWIYVPSPAEAYEFPAGSASGLGLYLPVAPTSKVNWSAGITYAEI